VTWQSQPEVGARKRSRKQNFRHEPKVSAHSPKAISTVVKTCNKTRVQPFLSGSVQPERIRHLTKMTTAVQAYSPSFDPLAPNATPSSSKHTFKTLERERLNRYPSTEGADHPSLDELVKPHIQSFNALMEGSDGKGKGLLQLGVEDLGSKVVFDGKGDGGAGGNKITCGYFC
jgi:hypothetical protein